MKHTHNVRSQYSGKHQHTQGERYAAVDGRDAAQTRAHAAYMRHLAVARVALRGDRGAALAAMDAWMRDFRAIARVALGE